MYSKLLLTLPISEYSAVVFNIVLCVYYYIVLTIVIIKF